MKNWLVGFVTVMFLVSCSSTYSSPDLDFDNDPNALVVTARMTPAGPPLLHFGCNSIPKLRIWGDGRVTMPVYNAAGERQVNLGHISQDKLADGLSYLRAAGFFTQGPPYAPNPSGSGFHMELNLKAGTFSQGWDFPNDPAMYTEFLRRMNPIEFKPFVPDQARLMAVVPKYGISTGIAGQWPAQFGFSLAEVPTDGRVIDGDTLSFVWKMLNTHDILGLQSGNQNYLVWLVIPELLLPFPGFACP